VTARISAVKAGLAMSIDELAAHFLAGGNVVRVVQALISADKADIEMPFKRAAAIDLAGRDVLEAVKMYRVCCDAVPDRPGSAVVGTWREPERPKSPSFPVATSRRRRLAWLAEVLGPPRSLERSDPSRA
jgi:hypothetical protein